MHYVFMSFGSIHTRKNIGCCIVQVSDPHNANEACRQLGLTPQECNEVHGYILETETEFQEQGMELNRFYTAAEMLQMGFQKE